MMRSDRGFSVHGILLAVLLSSAAFPPSQDEAKSPPHAGKITGVVVIAATGQPLAGAYVGAGDFGDSGGSNYARHRAQGLHAATETDAAGRFELAGLAFTGGRSPLAFHPLVVTHPRFVPSRREVALPEGAKVELTVEMTPAAAIRATAVADDGTPLGGPLLLRLEALDGHRFIPPGRDRHLSAFAASNWTELVRDGRFHFTELRDGEYAIDAIRCEIPARASAPEGYSGPVLAASATRYHGRIAPVRAESGTSIAVTIRPADHGTLLRVQLPALPADEPRPPLLRSPYLVVSRNAGLLAWDDGMAHSVEDARLGRIQKNALFYGLVPDAATFTIENLPPGEYAVFAGPVVFLRGAKVELSRGAEAEVDIPWREPQGHARIDVGRLDRRVALEARQYGIPELCAILTRAVDSRPQFRADPSLENAQVTLTAGEAVIWDVIEKLYRERAWRVQELGDDTLGLRPSE